MAGLSDTLSRFDVSGEILNEDVIGLLTQPDPRVPGAEMELGDCAAAFELLSEVWQEIRTEVADFDTSKLREKWLMPVFELLGHDLTFLRGHTEFANRKTIPLTHQSSVKVPVWMLDYGQSSDEKPTEGRNRRSPHELFQEYLDLTADSWGLLTNGRTLRLLHDYHKSLTRNFVEVDLEAVFESLDFDAFRAVWRIFHANAFKPGAKGVLPIEKLRDFSRQEGTEIGKELRFQVLEAIKVLGNGFLQADVSGELNKALKDEPVALMTFYRALLRIVYRLLFLLYVDNKPNWTPARDRVWSSSYSITRLRREAEDAAAEDGKFFFARAHSEDHWEGLKVVFSIIREGCQAFDAEIHPYGGDLFAEESLWLLKDAPLYNQDLLKAIRLLTMFERRARGRQRQIYRVNFRNLRIDALGSVYEALLDIAPVLKEDGSFDFGDGAERKLSGTYYTPPALVSEIVKAALLPVIEDRLAGVDESAQEAALLNIKVVDPACGSGAFLIQAMDALAARLCEIRYHGESPTDEQLRAARRDVVTKCIHGVDLNPMAVELCKFTLWLHVAHPELPLSYLEPVIVCGNALVGVPLKAQVEREKKRLAEERELVKKRTDLTPKQKQSALKKLEYVGWPESIPDEAFNAVTGDDADIAKLLKKRNKEEREGQPSLPFHREETQRELRAQKYLKFKQLSEDNIEAQRQKRELYERWRSDEDTKRQLFEADFWCSAFFWRSEVDGDAPTHHRFREIKEENGNAQPVSYWNDGLTRQIRDLARLPEPGDPQSSGLGFFHWELEFPDVDEQGGFDCILGNPPFVNAIEGGMSGAEKKFYEHDLSGVHGAADLAYRFLAKSAFLTNREGGWVGLIQPRVVLNAPPLEHFRSNPPRGLRPRFLWPLTDSSLFEGAAVFVTMLVLGPPGPCLVPLEPGAPLGNVRELPHVPTNWSLACSGQSEFRVGTGPRLGDVFQAAASMTTADAYDLQGFIVESTGSSLLRLTTTGLIDPGVFLWGQIPCRYLKSDYDRPVIVESGDLPTSLAKRCNTARRPKVLVAGLGKRLEAAFDELGLYIGAVSTFTITHPEDDVGALGKLCEHLNSEDVTLQMRAELGANAMGGGSITLKKDWLLDVRLPEE